jgi:prevent-host-death family protein
MNDQYVSIGQVKRDISQLVNRVAFGKERIVLTSRGTPKAALVSMEDYEKLQQESQEARRARLQAWMAEVDALAEKIRERTGGKTIDVVELVRSVREDLEQRDEQRLRGY